MVNNEPKEPIRIKERLLWLLARSDAPLTPYQLMKEIREETGKDNDSFVYDLMQGFEEDGTVTSTSGMWRTGRERKEYRLSFKGVVIFLSSRQPPESPDGTGEPGETEEQLRERFKIEWRAYRIGLDEFTGIIKRQGKILKYPLFEEYDDLERSLGFMPFHFFIGIANLMKSIPPLHKGWYSFRESQIQALRGLEDQLKRYKELERRLGHPFQIIEKNADGQEKTHFVTLSEDLEKHVEIQRELIDSLYVEEDKEWRDAFALRFAGLISHLLKNKMPNLKLHEFWQDLLDKKQKEFEDRRRELQSFVNIFQP